MGSDLQWSDLVAARLCHDLGGLAGTLGGCLELAAEDGSSEAIALAYEAAAALTARLRLLRAAWTEQPGPLDAAGLARLAAGLTTDRVSVEVWQLSGVLPAPRARLVLNLLLLAAEALPRGGQIAASGDADGELRISAEGPRLGWPVGLVAACPAGPQHLLPSLCALLAERAGLALAWDGDPPALVVRGPAAILRTR